MPFHSHHTRQMFNKDRRLVDGCIYRTDDQFCENGLLNRNLLPAERWSAVRRYDANRPPRPFEVNRSKLAIRMAVRFN